MGKWISVGNACVPTYGKHGEEFELTLKYHEYYGHISERRTEVVTAIWDSLNERFVEKRTGKEIAAEDIAEWYMEGEDGNV